MTLTIVLVLNFLLAVACGYLAQRRGRSMVAWSVAGALLGPVPLLVLAVLPVSSSLKPE